ncbi:MerR family transcriptional regulator [Halobacteriovorax sp. XZX-3]|uniref:MerR family transcriptional regulator n=1 Tax=unclassified Halobacteriovorax TaxID=2639665 RepID=UPI00371AF7AF
MKINEIVEKTNVSARSIRYYEKMGLIKPDRGTNNYREYTKEHVKIIERIKLFISAGVSLSKIQYIVPCTLHTDRVPMCRDLEELFFDEVKAIEQRIKDLNKSKKVLLKIIENRVVVE